MNKDDLITHNDKMMREMGFGFIFRGLVKFMQKSLLMDLWIGEAPQS